MAVYCYIAADGEPLEVKRPMGKAPASLRRHGKQFVRDYAREQRGTPQNRWGGGNHWRGNPLKSENFGGLPRQAKAFEKAMAMRGVPTKFCEHTGKAIFESREHRNRAMKSRGMYDQDAGYGDYSGDIAKEAPLDISAMFEGVE